MTLHEYLRTYVLLHNEWCRMDEGKIFATDTARVQFRQLTHECIDKALASIRAEMLEAKEARQ